MPELWDLYDRERRPLGRTIQRGEALPEGTYHLAVGIAVFNTKGDILLTQRAQVKSQYPGCWEIPGGCAQAETSLEAACRELREETGIVVQPGSLSRCCGNSFPARIWICSPLQRICPFPARPSAGETTAAQWLPFGEWLGRVGDGFYLTPLGIRSPTSPCTHGYNSTGMGSGIIYCKDKERITWHIK